MRNTFLICLCALLAISSSFAQKVKYKDLYVLLRVENYEDADKFLRIYLENEPEDPHANYSMGRMLQSYLNQGDLLNGSERLTQLADSSRYYYKRAYELTTEKFVRKHDDDYYQDFRRRDMRSGKFEVKFSDVQYDIEQRLEEVEQFSEDLKSLLSHFEKAQDYYTNCQAIYDTITIKTPTETLLYFTTTTDDINLMREMVQLYDSSLFELESYMKLMKGMGESAVEQKLVEIEIESFPNGGKGYANFYEKTIEYFDYKSWGNKTIDIILKQIFPLKKRLITFDKRVKDLHDEVVRDSLDKRDEVFRLATENVGRDLRDYDPNSLPAAIFNYRIAEINYHSSVHHWLQQIADTVDTGFKIDMLNDFTNQIAGVSKLVRKIRTVNKPQQIRLYGEYIKARYGSPEGVNDFIAVHEKEVRDDSLQLIKWMAEVKQLDKIAFWGTDSISLSAGEVKGTENETFTTILVDTLAVRTLGFYAWRQAGESLTLDFGVAPSSRQVDSLYQVPINDKVFDPTLPVPEFLMDTAGLGQRVWLLQSAEIQPDNTFIIQVILTDYTMGPSWSRELAVSDHVSQIKKEEGSKNLLILGEADKRLAVLDNYGEIVAAENDETEEQEPENDQGEQPEEGGGNR